MLSIATGTPPSRATNTAIPQWDTLSLSERGKYHGEFDYLEKQADREPDPMAAMKAYNSESNYHRVSTCLTRPYRVYTSALAGLGLALGPGLGQLANGLNGFELLNGAIQLGTGIGHKDRALATCGAFNVALGAASIAAAFTPVGPLTVLPLGIVVAREACMAALGKGFWK